MTEMKSEAFSSMDQNLKNHWACLSVCCPAPQNFGNVKIFAEIANVHVRYKRAIEICVGAYFSGLIRLTHSSKCSSLLELSYGIKIIFSYYSDEKFESIEE